MSYHFRKVVIGDEINVVRAAAGFNRQKLLRDGAFAVFPTVALSTDFSGNQLIPALCCHDLIKNISHSTTIDHAIRNGSFQG